MLNVTKIVTQTDRSLAIETSLGPDVFVLRSLRYESRLSQLFDLRLSVSPQHGLVRPEPLIGSEVRVRVSDHLGEARYFRGLVSEVSQKPHRDDATEFELAVVPRLWLLGRHLDHRIFQNLTVREIVKSYFTRYGVVIDDRCTDTYEPLEYCVQYGETDLAFVSRLLEHFGISYHFEHSDEKHVMVLTDGPAFFRALEGTPVIRFARDRTPVEPVSIRDWRSTTQLETGRVTCGTDFVVSASGNAGIKAAKMIVIDCPDITLKAAGGFIRINASGVTIQGAKIKLNSGGSAGSLSDDAAPAAAGSSSSSGSSAGSGGAGGAGGVGGPGGGGPLGSLSGIMQEIPTSALPNGVGDVFGSLASGQLPSLNSVLGMIPPGILPPKLQAALSAGQQALGALQSKVGAPTDSSGPEGASVSSLVDPSTSNDVDEDGRAVQPLAGIDTSTPDAFSKQAPDPDRRDAFIRKAIDATGGDLTASDDYLQKLRNASNGQMRYDKDLVAAQHYMKGASGANTLGSGVQDALSSVYEGIKHIPGGNYILSDPITQPPPSPPDSYVLQSAHKGSAAAGKSGVEGVRDDVKRKPKR